MKKALIILLILPALLRAQDIVSDTTYVIPAQGGGFNQVKETTYETGRKKTELIPYDTAQIISLYIGLAQSKANDVATAAVAAIARQRAVKQIRDFDQGVTAIAGFSSADSIARQVFARHIAGKSLEFDSAGVVRPAQVNPRQAGGYNLRVAGVNHRLDLFERRWIRIRNYPAQGTDTDLWLYRGEYLSFDGGFTLRTTDGSNIRAAQPAATQQATPAPLKKSTKKKSKQ